MNLEYCGYDQDVVVDDDGHYLVDNIATLRISSGGTECKNQRSNISWVCIMY